MAAMDEFKEEREAVKNGPLLKKIQYYVYYYKWHAIAIISFVVILGTWIFDVATSKDSIFYAAFVNSTQLDGAEAFNQGFADYAGIDTNEYDVVFDTTMYLISGSGDQNSVAASQKLVAYTSTGEFDILGANLTIFADYANSTFFYDLRDILTEEQLKACEPYFYYVDGAVVKAIEAADESFDIVEYPAIPDPKKPEEMEDPIPIGLFTENITKLTDAYYLSEEGSAIGVPCNTENLENAVKFIEYITQSK